MDTHNATYTVTDLRHKTLSVLKETMKYGYTLILRKSKPAAALVDMQYLKALQQAYEDYLDTLEFDSTIGLKRISLQKHKKEAF